MKCMKWDYNTASSQAKHASLELFTLNSCGIFRRAFDPLHYTIYNYAVAASSIELSVPARERKSRCSRRSKSSSRYTCGGARYQPVRAVCFTTCQVYNHFCSGSLARRFAESALVPSGCCGKYPMHTPHTVGSGVSSVSGLRTTGMLLLYK
jgi:hypothetical protein